MLRILPPLLYFRETMLTVETASGAVQADRPRVGDVLGAILRRPQGLLALWNWKSALLSVAMRGPIFFTAALSRGAHAALTALLLETAICAVGVGLYNALVQALRQAQPMWLTGTLLGLVFPGCVQTVEYLAHRAHGTPHLKSAAIVSLCVSSVSTLFNWYAMRNGALLVGQNSRGLLSDLRRAPRLILGFLTLLPRWVYRQRAPRTAGR
jgi:hypothetical protein